MKIKHNNLIELLLKAGYKEHFVLTGGIPEESYVRNRSHSRFHLYFNRDNNGFIVRTSGRLHCDRFKDGKHKIHKDENLIKKEIEYIRSFIPKIPSPEPKKEKEKSTTPRKGLYAKNYQQLVKRQVIKRSWYNPMRYIIGKFIYKKQ